MAVTATGTSRAEVLAAINAASIGETVNVPAGESTWTSEIHINKGISLIGAGIGSTIITNGGSGYLIQYHPSNYSLNSPFRLTGFEFKANGASILEMGGSISVPFTLQTKVRIDHNAFTNSGGDAKGQAIWNQGTLYGVVDHNLFDGISYPIANSYVSGAESWWANSPQNIFELGSEYYLYFEDNTFTNMGGYGGSSDNILMDGEFAARYVFRYNTVINDSPTYSLLDLHGEQAIGDMPACFGIEVYGNQISHGSNAMWCVKSRSGESMVFFNNATTSTTPQNRAYTSSICVCPSTYASLKVTHDTYWWGSRINLTGNFWDSICTGGLNCIGLTDIPTEGRYIFHDPSNPGVTRQEYWATDQSVVNLTGMVGADAPNPLAGTLYVCETTNVWTARYTPYTYPHPLQGVVPEELSKVGRNVVIM
jgi:hypothetical protein